MPVGTVDAGIAGRVADSPAGAVDGSMAGGFAQAERLADPASVEWGCTSSDSATGTDGATGTDSATGDDGIMVIGMGGGAANITEGWPLQLWGQHVMTVLVEYTWNSS